MVKTDRGLTDPQGRQMVIPDRTIVEMHLSTVRPNVIGRRAGRRRRSQDRSRPQAPEEQGVREISRGAWLRPQRAGMLAAMIVEEGRVRAATSHQKRNLLRLCGDWPILA